MLRLTPEEARRIGIALPPDIAGASSRKSKNRGGASEAQKILFGWMQEVYGSRIVQEFPPIPGRRFRIDIAFPKEKLAVEVDGWAYHGKTLGGFRHDRERQNMLTLYGWRILRFPAGDILRGRSEEILSVVRAALDHGL